MCHSQLTLFVPEQATLLSFRLMPLDSYFFSSSSRTFINLNIVLANYVVHIIHYILSLIKCRMCFTTTKRHFISYFACFCENERWKQRKKNKDGTSDIKYSAYRTLAEER